MTARKVQLPLYRARPQVVDAGQYTPGARLPRGVEVAQSSVEHGGGQVPYVPGERALLPGDWVVLAGDRRMVLSPADFSAIFEPTDRISERAGVRDGSIWRDRQGRQVRVLCVATYDLPRTPVVVYQVMGLGGPPRVVPLWGPGGWLTPISVTNQGSTVYVPRYEEETS